MIKLINDFLAKIMSYADINKRSTKKHIIKQNYGFLLF